VAQATYTCTSHYCWSVITCVLHCAYCLFNSKINWFIFCHITVSVNEVTIERIMIRNPLDHLSLFYFIKTAGVETKVGKPKALSLNVIWPKKSNNIKQTNKQKTTQLPSKITVCCALSSCNVRGRCLPALEYSAKSDVLAGHLAACGVLASAIYA